VTRRHVDDQPLQLAARNALELFGNDQVVPTFDEVFIDVMGKGHELVLRQFPNLQLALGISQEHKLLEDVMWDC
jgi:hypothetical protein